MKFRSRRNAVNSQSEFSSPLRGEFAVPRYFKQLPKSIRFESRSNLAWNFPRVNLRSRSFASTSIISTGETRAISYSCIRSKIVEHPSAFEKTTRWRTIFEAYDCVFPDCVLLLTNKDPINHPADLSSVDLWHFSIVREALCKLYSSRHLPSRGDSPFLATFGLLLSFDQFPSCVLTDRPPFVLTFRIIAK